MIVHWYSPCMGVHRKSNKVMGSNHLVCKAISPSGPLTLIVIWGFQQLISQVCSNASKEKKIRNLLQFSYCILTPPSKKIVTTEKLKCILHFKVVFLLFLKGPTTFFMWYLNSWCLNLEINFMIGPYQSRAHMTFTQMYPFSVNMVYYLSLFIYKKYVNEMHT